MLGLDDPTLVIYGDDHPDDESDSDKLTEEQLRHYYTLWCNKSDFDFTISLNRKHGYHGHERILRTNRYFALLFRSKSVGTKRSVSIDYDVITPRAFTAILEYFYTRTMALCDEIVEEVCVAASYFMESSALAYCVRHLTRCMTLKKAVKGLDLALRHQIVELKDAMMVYLVERFDSLAASDCFTSLSLDVMMALVESSNVVVYNEDVVWKACCDWIKHSLHERQKHTGQLVRKLRVRFLSSPLPPCVITNSHKPPTTDHPCRKYWNGLYMITNHCIHHYSPERGDAAATTTEIARVIHNTHDDVIVTCDGNVYFISSEGALRCFDPRTKMMTSPTPLPVTSSPMEKFCACAHGRKLYIFSTLGIHIYTPATDSWEVVEGGQYIDEDASISSISATSFFARYILLGDCTFGGHTPLLLIDPQDNCASSRVHFQLPHGFYYRLVAYEQFLLFFGVSQSGAGSNILMVYDINKEMAVCCALDGLFESSDVEVRRCHFIFFFHRFKLQRHGSHVYFIEQGKERYGEFRNIKSVKRVDLEELLQEIWEPGFQFASICRSLDVEIGLENFELLSL